MALFFDGFEQFSRTDRPETLVRLAGYTTEGTMVMTAGRKSGGYAFSLYRAALMRAWTFSGTVMSFGFAVKFDVRGPIVSVRVNATNVLTVYIDPDTGLINFGGEVGYVNPLKTRWYYMEVELDRTTNQARLYVNGKLDITAPLPTSVTGAITLRLNPYEAVPPGATADYGTKTIDDLYISDTVRLQPMQITTRFPTATIDSDWSVTGAGSHHAAVTPPVDTLDKFIFTSINDAHDSFTSATVLPDGGAVKHLQLITLFRKATTDPMSLELNIDGQKVTVANISRDWTYRYTPMSASGYDAGNIVQAEFGVRLKL